MAGKNNRLGSGEISNMFDFSHGLNRPQPTLTGSLGLSIFLKPSVVWSLVPLTRIGYLGLGTPGDASGHLVGSGLNRGLVGA